MTKTNTEILDVEPRSHAKRAGISAGDVLLKVNGHEVHDILEYRFLTAEYSVTLTIKKSDGSVEEIEIENDYEDLGLVFKEELLCSAQSCTNKCIFCFIDQLPPGMRETVYFKDDDARLSFLQGNYVTMTNMTDEEINRLIQMRVSPINISVHTTNPSLRKRMLNNRFAGRIFEIMQHLAENHIFMNCQIVLCPGINDGEELKRTLDDIASLSPYTESVSVVPVGVTAYREGLFELKSFDAEGCKHVIETVEKIQKENLEKLGTRLVYLSDEFYTNADIEPPKAENYEGFPQLENGVGLIASMTEEIDHALELIKNKKRNRHVTIATGESAYNFMCCFAEKTEAAAEGVKIDVIAVKNKFFGGKVTVAGLICGCDLLNALKENDISGDVLIASSMLKSDEDIFLDDMTLSDVEKLTGTRLIPTDNDGYILLENVLGEELEF